MRVRMDERMDGQREREREVKNYREMDWTEEESHLHMGGL